MGSNLFIILLLVSAVWQIVGSIAEKKAKQKQQEELARRRSEASSSSPAGRGDAADAVRGERTRLDASGGADARSRSEQIAARRKAQIDELRRRAAERAQAGGAERTSSRPGGRTVAADSSRRSTPASRPTKEVAGSSEGARDWDQLTQKREAERAARSEGRRQQELRDAAEKRRKDIAHKQARRDRQAADDAAAAMEQSARRRSRSGGEGSAFVAGVTAGGTRADRLHGLMRNREAVRDAFMLHELLASPVAMRQQIVPSDANRDR